MTYEKVSRLGFSLLFLMIGFSEKLLAIALYDKNIKIGFIHSKENIKVGLEFPFHSQVVKIDPSIKVVKNRILKFDDDKRIEPLYFFLPKEKNKLRSYVKKYAKPGNLVRLYKNFKKIVRGDRKDSGKKYIKVPVTPKLAKMVSIHSLKDKLSKNHYQVNLDVSALKIDPNLAKKMLRELRLFLTFQERKEIRLKIARGEDISLEKHLVPMFPRKMLRKFISYRGPNCFQAALAFHSKKVAYSPLVNVKREVGYHRAMINYDELWRAINAHFYEVDPQKSDLKYGDMLVFFDVPQNWHEAQGVSFRWIRHTSTYLFNQFTFSKGSKSPNTPYSIKTLSDEWETWRRHVPRIGVKIYRRAQVKLSRSPPFDLIDWIY